MSAASSSAAVPAAVALGLPVALARISLPVASLSLIVSALLLLVAVVAYRETVRAEADAPRAARVIARLYEDDRPRRRPARVLAVRPSADAEGAA